MTYHSDYWSYGFKRSEILVFLGIENEPEIKSTPANDKDDSWKNVYRAQPFFEPEEAAFIICGMDPHSKENLPSDFYPEVTRFIRVIRSAIEAEILPAWTVNYESDWRISQSNLKAWCSENGFEWPLSEPVNKVSANLKIRDEVVGSKTEKSSREDCSNHQKIVDDLTRCKVEVEQLKQEIVAEKKAHADTYNELNLTRQDIASGKSKSTLLKLVGAMAVSGFGLSIWDRLTKLSQFQKDIQSVGVSIDDDTVRNYLKQASDLIERPK